MIQNMTIQKATVQDAATLARLAGLLWDSHFEEELKAEFETLLLKTEEAVLFLLFIENEAAGFAQCQLRHDYVEGTESSPVGYLEGVFVKEEYRRMGCGKALIQKCEAWAAENGCTEFASDCELTNETSLRFHLGAGFQEANRIICFTKKLVPGK